MSTKTPDNDELTKLRNLKLAFSPEGDVREWLEDFKTAPYTPDELARSERPAYLAMSIISAEYFRYLRILKTLQICRAVYDPDLWITKLVDMGGLPTLDDLHVPNSCLNTFLSSLIDKINYNFADLYHPSLKVEDIKVRRDNLAAIIDELTVKLENVTTKYLEA